MTLALRGKAELLAQAYAVLAAAIFLIFGLVYLYLGYVPMTHQDFWRIYDILLNQPWWQGALLKFNGHSLFFPALIWQADLRFFHGSQQLLFFIGLALLGITTGLLVLSVWRDTSTGTTAKLAATLVLVVGDFWMGRASMIESGAFNCCYSLTMVGVALAFLYLPAMRQDLLQSRFAILLIILSGFLATFSFGSGLVVWPTLVFIGWCLRLPLRSLAILAAATLIAALIYALLPPHLPHEYVLDTKDWFASDWPTALGQLSRLIGSPVFYAASAWRKGAVSHQAAQTYPLAFWGGAAGITFALLAALPRLWRRDLAQSRLQTTGLALVIFNSLVFVMIVLSRNQHFRSIPNEVVAPRYVFWSSLFWAGLLLLAIDAGERRPRLRWAGLLLAFAIPILAWPEHIQEGFHWKYARLSAAEDAMSLINSVNDPKRQLFPDPRRVEVLAPQLRVRRLDIFAAGLQDWIGQPISNLFHGHKDIRKYRGRAEMKSLPDKENETASVRVTGQISPKSDAIPAIMVILDSNGTVAGIASVSSTSDFLNRLFYRGRMPSAHVAGYIRQYDPMLHYVMRAAGRHGLAKTPIDVAPLSLLSR